MNDDQPTQPPVGNLTAHGPSQDSLNPAFADEGGKRVIDNGLDEKTGEAREDTEDGQTAEVPTQDQSEGKAGTEGGTGGKGKTVRAPDKD